MYLLAVCMSSLEKMFIEILCPFLNQIVFSLLSCMTFLHILDVNPLSDI